MKAIKLFLIAIPVALSLLTCSEDDSERTGLVPSDSSDVPLSDDQAEFLATLEDTVIHLEDIYFDDGLNVLTFLKNNDPGFLRDYPYGRTGQTKALTPFQQKQLFFSRMYVMGYFLADDSEHTHPAAGPNSPAQTGLAYSWGSKDYNIRQIPPVASGCMTLKIHGLDCTGMLWAMTQAANLTVVPKYNFFVEQINTAQKWTDAFKASSDYKDLEMKDMGQLPPGEIHNGDIIFWGSHVGVSLYGWFYQSNGSANAPGCNNNLSRSRGPRMISLGEVLGYNLGAYKVFRTIHEHNFSLRIKYNDDFACGYKGQIYKDSVELDVKVKEDEVTVSNIINHVPSISPPTINIVSNCKLTCNPGSIGIYNVVSGSGRVWDLETKFEVDLVHRQSGTGGSALVECPNAPPIPAPGPTTVADHTEHWTFVLADSTQRQGSTSPYGVFVTLTPK